MALFQRSLTAAVAAAALAGAFALPASAQPAAPTAGPAATAPAARHQAPDFAKRHAERTERMKTLLQLQPNQQAAWDKYVQATTPQPRPAADERPDLRKLTTPERLDLAQKMRKEHTAHAEQRDQATRSFYNSLNASQQKAFDELTAHRPGKFHRGGQGERMGHQPGHPHGPAGQPMGRGA
ncbi:Spy/CpxP family protein refolding chaperone [Comamonas aquatica]|uniref:Spy/CpxP family protein refolding chaperone n=1 Tax=Comamonas aquatica TaxID=225991 RepID=UPI00244C5ACD|nr:Spy/CpxP family protein refolding chaperone [Comamonas aquatica]MDH1764124.1 Spy/CpxP family protein refolding chaperone [Comamonas aquatica]